MVAENAAGHHRADGQQDIAVHSHCHGDCNGHHDGERAPAGSRAEGHQCAHQEDDGRAEGTVNAVTQQAGKELAGSHSLDDPADGEGQHQKDHQTHHAADALHNAVAELLGGHDPLLCIHDAHNEQCDDNRVEDRRGSVARRQISSAGDQQTDESAADQGDEREHHVPLVLFAFLYQLFKAVIVIEQRRYPVIIQLAGVPHPQLCLFHGAPVFSSDNIEQHEQQGEDAVKLEGEAPDQQIHRLALNVSGGDLRGDQAHQHSAPGVQGNDGIDRRGSRVADVGQLFTGDLEFIDQRAGHHAGEHDTEQTVDKNDDADHIGDEHRHPRALHALALLGQVIDEALDAAGDAHQDHKRAHQRREQEGFQIPGVGANT